MSKADAETIRVALNEKATEILSEPSPSSYERYAEFCGEYDEAIYRSWYISLAPLGQNVVLGYTLVEDAARGAFGTVYRAVSKDGGTVAIKVLHEGIRNNPDLLQSFRRGVRSMRILGEHAVEGIVAYQDAYEIPAFVVTDWIDGPNLARPLPEGI